MSNPAKPLLLLVDDEPSIRESLATVLLSSGYDVSTATGGFDALLCLKGVVPEVIISDLNMPHMSGFEFLSIVRRRFPQISVVAMSGAYTVGAVPSGVIADAFYAKGQEQPEKLLNIVTDLLRTSALQANSHHREVAPVWIPRNGKDSRGNPYIVLTCTECLRSFPLSVPGEPTAEVVETMCLYCGNKVRYIVDFSLSVSSPPKRVGATRVVPAGKPDAVA